GLVGVVLIGFFRVVLTGIVLARLVLVALILIRAPLALVRIVAGCLVATGGRGRRRQRRQRQPVAPGWQRARQGNVPVIGAANRPGQHVPRTVAQLRAQRRRAEARQRHHARCGDG